jgi:hypothetical protein
MILGRRWAPWRASWPVFRGPRCVWPWWGGTGGAHTAAATGVEELGPTRRDATGGARVRATSPVEKPNDPAPRQAMATRAVQTCR